MRSYTSYPEIIFFYSDVRDDTESNVRVASEVEHTANGQYGDTNI